MFSGIRYPARTAVLSGIQASEKSTGSEIDCPLRAASANEDLPP
jgi:hypothetical protein